MIQPSKGARRGAVLTFSLLVALALGAFTGCDDAKKGKECAAHCAKEAEACSHRREQSCEERGRACAERCEKNEEFRF
jgi:hypothetical protein